MCSVLFLDVKEKKVWCVADGMPHLWPWQMGKLSSTVYFDVTLNLLKNVSYVLPHCAKHLHSMLPRDKDVICPVI